MDALLLVSFGGPERDEDVLPFLENVLRGRSVPRERMLEVAKHYYHFGGRSPINDHNRALLAALRDLLQQNGPRLPVYWGNRNWHPFLADTFRMMMRDGVRRVFAFVTSAYGSYSGCRQYLDDLARAREEAGANHIEILKLRAFYNHPGFIEPMIERVEAALAQVPEERRDSAAIRYTAHSIPESMVPGSPYVEQLHEACRLVAAGVGRPEFRLIFQSRSGPPQQPWLGPDILEELRALAAAGVRDVVIVPIGFTSDHMEVVYDLDTEAAALARELGLHFVRAGTAGEDPRFVAMIRDLVLERRSRGDQAPGLDECAAGCCPAPLRPRPSGAR